MSRTRCILSSVLLLLAVASCDKAKRDEASPPVDKASVTPSDKSTPADKTSPVDDKASPSDKTVTAQPGTAPIVTLKDPGRAPQRQVRFHLAAGSKHQVSMVMHMGMQMTIGDRTAPEVPIPAMKLPMEGVVTEVLPNGDFRYSFKFLEPEVVKGPADNPAVVESLEKTLGSLKGISGGALMSPTGIPREATLDIPPTVDPQVRQLMEGMRESLTQIAAPLPEEAIGPGAKWDVQITVRQNGMTMKQMTHYELVSMDGDHLKVHATLEQSADRQHVSPPGLPPGTTAELLELSGTGEGDTEVDLTKLMPTKGVVGIKSRFSMSVAQGATKMDMKMKMDMTCEVECK